MATATGTPPPFRTSAPRLGFVGGLDGLRGVLILLVMLEHANIGRFRSATGGVDIFYVISGFLITSLLLQEHRANGSIDVRKFYARRALRLLPSVWLMLVTVTVLVAVFARDLLSGLLREAAAAFFYVYQIFYPVGYDLFHDMTRSTRVYMLVQLWSLSVEEQFYLIIAVTAIVFIRRDAMRSLAAILLTAVLAAWVARWLGHPGPRAILIQRPDNLAVGMLLAIANAHIDQDRARRWRIPLLVAGTVGIVVAAVTMFAGSVAVWKVTTSVFGIPRVRADGLRTQGWSALFWPMRYDEAGYPALPWRDPSTTSVFYWWQFGPSLVGLAIAPTVLCMARYHAWFANRWLSLRPLRFLGRLSYTLYVWHGFFFMAIEHGLAGSMSRPALMTLQFVVGFAVSLAVYFGVERRVLRSKLRFASDTHTVDLTRSREVDIS